MVWWYILRSKHSNQILIRPVYPSFKFDMKLKRNVNQFIPNTMILELDRRVSNSPGDNALKPSANHGRTKTLDYSLKKLDFFFVRLRILLFKRKSIYCFYIRIKESQVANRSSKNSYLCIYIEIEFYKLFVCLNEWTVLLTLR